MNYLKLVLDTLISALKICVCSPFWWALIIGIFVCLPTSVGVEMATSKKELIINLIFFLLGLAYIIVFIVLNALGVWVI